MLRLRAPAKLNLTLEVLARRDDGYHALRSLMVPIGLYDVVTLEPSRATSFRCDDPRVGADNTVVRALANSGCAPVAATLEKHIPIGAGLGGGSSDAAAIVLAAMDGRIERAGPAPDWLALARSLGSDVPFFLVGTGALVEGTGERVTACGRVPPWWAVVVQPAASVATMEAYRLLDEHRAAHGRKSRARSASATLAAVDGLQRGRLADVVAAMCNDFEAVAFERFTSVARANAVLSAAAGMRALLCGSGACSFTLFDDESVARRVADEVAASVAAAWCVPLVADERWR